MGSVCAKESSGASPQGPGSARSSQPWPPSTSAHFHGSRSQKVNCTPMFPLWFLYNSLIPRSCLSSIQCSTLMSLLRGMLRPCIPDGGLEPDHLNVRAGVPGIAYQAQGHVIHKASHSWAQASSVAMGHFRAQLTRAAIQRDAPKILEFVLISDSGSQK